MEGVGVEEVERQVVEESGRATGEDAGSSPRSSRSAWPPRRLDASARCKRYKKCKSQVHVRKDIVKTYRKGKAPPISKWQGLFSTHSPTGRWVDSAQAKIVVFLLILLNTGFVALEAYMQEDVSIQNNIWMYFSVQLVFSIVFAVEPFGSSRVELIEFPSCWTQHAHLSPGSFGL